MPFLTNNKNFVITITFLSDWIIFLGQPNIFLYLSKNQPVPQPSKFKPELAQTQFSVTLKPNASHAHH